MRIFTGQKNVSKCSLIVIETSLGWTFMGKVNELFNKREQYSDDSNVSTDLMAEGIFDLINWE